MGSCLMVLKLAMARLAEDDEHARAEKGEIMREHLDSCPSCASFVEGFGHFRSRRSHRSTCSE